MLCDYHNQNICLHQIISDNEKALEKKDKVINDLQKRVNTLTKKFFDEKN